MKTTFVTFFRQLVRPDIAENPYIDKSKKNTLEGPVHQNIGG
jgi:hypothetical protein